jgi:hypothetical protein
MPEPYRVSYSERVHADLEDRVARAKARGLLKQVHDALKTIDDRLRIYPQFGQPLRDLQLETAQVWIAVVPPLTVQYVLHEQTRPVWIVVPIRPLPNSGLDP